MTAFLHATAAALYIAFIITGISSASSFVGPQESIFIPMAMLGLLVFSVALMGYLFFAEPLRLYLAGDATSGITLFLRTLGIFALYVLLALALVVVLSFR